MDESIVVPPIKPDRTQFEKIKTGNGFQNDLIATTNDRLELTVIELQKLQQNNTLQTSQITFWLGEVETAINSKMKALQADIRKLNLTIEIANDKNDKTQRLAIALAVIGTIFTGLSLIQVIDILRQWFSWW